MNTIWLLMMIVGVVATVLRPGGGGDEVTVSVATGAAEAVKLTISLIGMLAFWSGIMRLAEAAGMTQALSRRLSPLVCRLFPSVPRSHPAMGAILMAFSANILGLGNAATPLGIKAMQELQRLNPRKSEASDAMCTLIAICASGLTLVPTTIISLRATAGSKDPAAIVGATLFATAFSTGGALLADRLFRAKAAPPIPPPPAHRAHTRCERRADLCRWAGDRRVR